MTSQGRVVEPRFHQTQHALSSEMADDSGPGGATSSSETSQNMAQFGTDWEMFDAVPYGVQVQEIDCPYIMETVQSMINPLASSESFGRDIDITMVQCIESLRPTQEMPEM
ncbi:hypothetical protein ATANTOWER_022554 [Ataeniobius toweri]|uniref:Uncharacterized protein n=1 Tax=Ataeniobius toweri TaxID=208326 RepID=A0ABU7BK63_9TELE|nr:hypothetical protein [Ataeniobius toweri]